MISYVYKADGEPIGQWINSRYKSFILELDYSNIKYLFILNEHVRKTTMFVDKIS